MTHALIIGNGIAGVTAARRLRTLQPDWRITMVSGESAHHYSRPALMYIFMGHMKYADTKMYEDRIWRDERIDLVRDWVTEVDTGRSRVRMHRGGEVTYDVLLLATGSRSNKFGWPGQDLRRVQGLYDLMDLHQLYESVQETRSAVIVGGGLIGIELAEMLHSRGIHVTFLAREEAYWNNVLPPEEAEMVSRVIRDEGFDLRLQTELKEIVGDDTGAACAVVTGHGDRIDAQFVGLTAGVSPNIDLVRDSAVETERGVLVDRSLRTSGANVFAAGDCAEIVQPGESRNLIQQVWYTGRRQGRAVAESMAGREVRYDPGIWFNSAKFLDLEYQTYGTVPSRPQPGQSSLWWEDAGGRHGMRLVYTEDGLQGLNVMGIRSRHEVCEAWIRDRRGIEYVLDHLAEANFDTEFLTRHEDEIVATLREQMA